MATGQFSYDEANIKAIKKEWADEKAKALTAESSKVTSTLILKNHPSEAKISDTSRKKFAGEMVQLFLD